MKIKHLAKSKNGIKKKYWKFPLSCANVGEDKNKIFCQKN